MNNEDLKSDAARIIGQIVLSFSSLEFNLGLCLRNLAAGEKPELLNPLVERLSFKHKLDALQELISIRFADCADCIAQFSAWFKEMGVLRQKRNRFIHGRWGVHHAKGVVINVAPKLPRGESHEVGEYTYDIAMLEAEYQQVLGMQKRFDKLRQNWNV